LLLAFADGNALIYHHFLLSKKNSFGNQPVIEMDMFVTPTTGRATVQFAPELGLMAEASPSTISVLLVSRDSAETALISEAMTKFGVYVMHLADAEAVDFVKCHKFEAAVVDFDSPLAGMILEQLRESPSNKTAITFAIVNRRLTPASSLKVRATFVLEKPLTASLIYRTLQAAYGMILQERRRYFRCPITVPVAVQRRSETKISAHTVNISQNGLALSTPVTLTKGDLVSVQFKLPQMAAPIAAEAAVRWYRDGRAGLLFLSLDPNARTELSEWLSKRMEAFLRPVQ
jgi:CheY-like chemotaxis protein